MYSNDFCPIWAISSLLVTYCCFGLKQIGNVDSGTSEGSLSLFQDCDTDQWTHVNYLDTIISSMRVKKKMSRAYMDKRKRDRGER